MYNHVMTQSHFLKAWERGNNDSTVCLPRRPLHHLLDQFLSKLHQQQSNRQI
jgi:hypothetical protein